jgi:Methyl-CpG binding domain
MVVSLPIGESQTSSLLEDTANANNRSNHDNNNGTLTRDGMELDGFVPDEFMNSNNRTTEAVTNAVQEQEVNDETGNVDEEAMKIVKSILKQSSKKYEKPSTAAIIQRWWKSTGNIHTNVNKSQQEILSTMIQSKAGVTTTTTTTTTAAAAATTTTTTTDVNDHQKQQAKQQPANDNVPEALPPIAQPGHTDHVQIINSEIIDSRLATPPKSISPLASVVVTNGTGNNVASHKRAIDTGNYQTQQPHRFKKIAAKTVLSQKHTTQNITNVASMMAPARAHSTNTTATMNNNYTHKQRNTSLNRPPMEVTIETPIKKEYTKHDATANKKNKKNIKTKVPPIKKKSTAKKPTAAAVAKKKQVGTNVSNKSTATKNSDNKLNGNSTTETVATTTTNSKANKNNRMIWEGAPNDVVAFTINWDGWMKRSYERQNGATKERLDYYWYTPIQKYKLRSIKEVERFVQHYNDNGQDEIKALDQMKKRK